jgi:drug/metabolite transporter (DMT)-like permease
MGVFGSTGMLFQMDGLAHTEASTSAFLTQCYVFFLPLWQAVIHRRPPSRLILGAGLAVLAGVGILSGVTWQNLRLGRGELETLLASVLFTGQILWLQRPRYQDNDIIRFTVVMFVVMALCMAPLIALSAPDWEACWRPYASGPSLLFLAVLVGVSTLIGSLLMNRWQRELTVEEAGLIYCIEPVFASVLALWLPAWLAAFAHIEYANETLTWRLLGGGGLIVAANVAVQLAPHAKET